MIKTKNPKLWESRGNNNQSIFCWKLQFISAYLQWQNQEIIYLVPEHVSVNVYAPPAN
jgi:hypothetical protein